MRYFSFSFYWFQFANILSRISASMFIVWFSFLVMSLSGFRIKVLPVSYNKLGCVSFFPVFWNHLCKTSVTPERPLRPHQDHHLPALHRACPEAGSQGGPVFRSLSAPCSARAPLWASPGLQQARGLSSHGVALTSLPTTGNAALAAWGQDSCVVLASLCLSVSTPSLTPEAPLLQIFSAFVAFSFPKCSFLVSLHFGRMV